MDPNEEYMSVADVAAHFKVTRQSIYTWINEGRIDAIRIGSHKYITRAAVKRKEDREKTPEANLEDVLAPSQYILPPTG